MGKDHSNEFRRRLLALARQSIEQELTKSGNTGCQDLPELAEAFTKKRGTFVSLHINGRLRGCIGNIEPVKTVYEGVVDNAKHAAFNDTRFDPLTLEELKDTAIEVSILTPSKPVDYTDANDLISKIRPGIDGVTVKKRYHSATFLPQVWTQLKKPEDFLSHLCMKAGLPSDEWRSNTLQVFVYQVQRFEEGESI